jgi:hypothetical protein
MSSHVNDVSMGVTAVFALRRSLKVTLHFMSRYICMSPVMIISSALSRTPPLPSVLIVLRLSKWWSVYTITNTLS